mgnify:CR=1 FL=1
MKRVHVAAAVIRGADGRVLIAKRPQDKHQGGLWEFPGGKVEEGEAVERALARELEEELGIRVEAARPLIQVHHDYPDKQVLLDVWEVSSFTGEPHGAEGQPLAWVSERQLLEYEFPAANKPIVAVLRDGEALARWATEDAHAHAEVLAPAVRAVLAEAGVQIAPSSYYARRVRPPSARTARDAVIDERLAALHEENMGVYGARKMWKVINRTHPGDPVARCTVERRMRALGLSGVPNARTTRTTRPAPPGGHEPRDRLERDFTAAAPDQRWVADITYVATWTGFVYVAFVMDLFARRIVGWRVSRSLRTDLALDALEHAIWTRSRDQRDLSRLVHHSDKGVQGEFNRSSQHLDREVKRWEQPHGRSGSVRIEDRSRHRDGPRSRGGRTESRSGRLSLAA